MHMGVQSLRNQGSCTEISESLDLTISKSVDDLGLEVFGVDAEVRELPRQ